MAEAKKYGVYRVAYRLLGLVALPLGTNWVSREFAWAGVAAGGVQLVGEWKEDEFGTPMPSSTRIVVEVSADGVEEATEQGLKTAERVARVMQFQAGVPHMPVEPIAALDVTPGKTQRQYSQWLYGVVPARPARQVTVSSVETTAHAIGQRAAGDREAILRGLKWYTDALNEPDPVDRFLKAWVGLESIGAPLNRRAHKSGWRSCKKCLGSEASRQADFKQERGIRHVFSVVEPEMPFAFDTLKKARNKLVHSEWTLERVRAEVEPLVSETLQVLGSGLLTALAPEGTSAGTRDALVPMEGAPSALDAQLTVTIPLADPNGWDELFEKFDVTPELKSSTRVDGVYKADAGVHIVTVSPCPIENMTVVSRRRAEDGIELTIDRHPQYINSEPINEGSARSQTINKGLS
jgi:hypothetical protein